jgi:phage terminase large subunit
MIKTIDHNFDLAPWAKFLLKPMRYKVVHGGRGGAKTFSFACAIVILGAISSINVICAREFQNSIDDSVKPAIEKAIIHCGLEECYTVHEKKIIGINGTKIKFKGLARNKMSIKGWDDLDILWNEEAHTTSSESLELMIPTIIRKPGAELWLSFNRHSISDPVDKYFLGKDGPPDNSIVKHVNYTENPFFTQELESSRIHCEKYQPERYAHIWLGAPDQGTGKNKVMPYALVKQCIAYKDKDGLYLKNEDKKVRIPEPSGMKHAGLDIGDVLEGDPNAYALRQCSFLLSVSTWQVPKLHMTTAKADIRNRKNGVVKMYYDAGGIGAGVKSDLDRLPTNPQDGTGPGKKKFVPFHFGGKVRGGERQYVKGKKYDRVLNKDFFAKVNMQAAWNLRQRAENTIKLIDGEKVDLDRCLFIMHDIVDIELLLAEASQGVYDDSGGKMKYDKAPNGEDSPNMWDSVIMAYASDLKKGLKAGK